MREFSAMRALTVPAGSGNFGSMHAALAAQACAALDATFDAYGMRLRLGLPGRPADGLKACLRDATRHRVRIDDNG